MHTFILQLFHQGQQVFCAAGKAAEIMDEHGIAFPHKVQHGLQLGALGILAADFFSEPFINAVGLEGFYLAGFILFHGGNADIGNIHFSFSSLVDKIASRADLQSGK